MNSIEQAYQEGARHAFLEKTAGPKTELLRKLMSGAGFGAAAGGVIVELTTKNQHQIKLTKNKKTQQNKKIKNNP
jgi:hypothetical protein